MPDPNPVAVPTHALSVKQPWAALLALGLKSVEVRTWPTRRRGAVWIHAGSVPDDRPEAWEWVTTPELKALAGLTGGVIGTADLADCVVYEDATSFLVDVPRHRNAPSWFKPPRLYGFVFAAPRVVPYRRCPGNTFFFALG